MLISRGEYVTTLILEMMDMQRELDNAIYAEHNVEFDKEKCKLAMIDEIGEFNHEIKSTWCWWKKTQAPIDKANALEELVDIWHFALSLTYHEFDKLNEPYRFLTNAVGQYDLPYLYEMVVRDEIVRLEALDVIGGRFGFTIDDVYRIYKKKNQINYNRLKENY